MIIDARTFDAAKKLDADICIIGAGAAGLTLARELDGSALTVLLMESGGMEPDTAVDDLKVGSLEGPVFERQSQYLIVERARFFGGTTNVWEGLCQPLMEIDFEQRDWMPNSGWPIARKDLDPYYARASAHIGLHPPGAAFPDSAEQLDCKLLPADSEWDAQTLQMSPRPRLAENFKAVIEASRNITVVLHANALLFHENENRSRIQEVEFATLAGARFRVAAKKFVLSAGGLENSRILLNSNEKTGGAVGNRHDNLGRYWVDQLHIPAGRMMVPNPLDDHNLFFRVYSETLGYVKMGGIGLKPEAQRKRRLSNQVLVFDVGQASWYGDEVRPLTNALAALHDNDSVRRSKARIEEPLEYWFRFKSEQTVDRENRVTLTDDLDALGQRRLRVKWEISEYDRQMMVRYSELLADAVGEHFIGRVLMWYNGEAEMPQHAMGHGHQLGGTRMSSDPTKGVVDANCRAHGTENLYIVGGSVFPSGGRTNPTLTILALAIRLAERLKETA